MPFTYSKWAREKTEIKVLEAFLQCYNSEYWNTDPWVTKGGTRHPIPCRFSCTCGKKQSNSNRAQRVNAQWTVRIMVWRMGFGLFLSWFRCIVLLTYAQLRTGRNSCTTKKVEVTETEIDSIVTEFNFCLFIKIKFERVKGQENLKIKENSFTRF